MVSNWAVQRTGQAVVTVVGVVTISFALVRLMPGGPMQSLMARMVAEGATAGEMEAAARRVEQMMSVRPNQPLWKQYIDYVQNIAAGNLGTSLWYDQPVADILATALPWTIFLMGSALFINFFFAVALGALMAYKEKSAFDFVGTTYSLFITSIPYYITGLVLIFVFAYRIPLFPDGGRYPSNLDPEFTLAFFVGVVHHAALPIASWAFTRMGRAINMRANSIQVLGDEYVRVARLRGLPTGRISMRYVGWNAILPLYTGVLIAIGSAFGGSVILETIFNYPGVGYFMFQAINFRDYSLLMGGFLVITLAVVAGLYIADVTYGLIDPRVSVKGEGE